jgi:hypothetical protein
MFQILCTIDSTLIDVSIAMLFSGSSVSKFPTVSIEKPYLLGHLRALFDPRGTLSRIRDFSSSGRTFISKESGGCWQAQLFVVGGRALYTEPFGEV